MSQLFAAGQSSDHHSEAWKGSSGSFKGEALRGCSRPFRLCGLCPTASLGWYFSWHVHVVVYISCNAGIHLPYALICSMPTSLYVVLQNQLHCARLKADPKPGQHAISRSVYFLTSSPCNCNSLRFLIR